MNELVYINNNHVLTTSLLVAEKLGKEHKHVLEAIRGLLNTKAGFSAFVDNQQLTKMFALTDSVTFLWMLTRKLLNNTIIKKE